MKHSSANIYFSIFLSCMASNSFASKPVWTFTPSINFPPVAKVTPNGEVRVEYVVNNQSSKSKNLVMIPRIGISQTSPCLLGPKGSSTASCMLSLTVEGRLVPDSGLTGGPELCEAGSTNRPNLNQCYQPSASNRLAITKAAEEGPVLSSSTQNLALSITGLTLDGQPSGQPRLFTITNTGLKTADDLTVVYPTWPTGTSVDNSLPTACANTTNLSPGASCSITVIPGGTVSSGAGNAACTTGIEPLPSVVTVQATGANPIDLNVVVLSYGCIYQSGYIYSMLETVNPAQSIGGTVVSLEDQIVNGIIWGSNGDGATSADQSRDSIPGIAETSTSSSSVPTYADSETVYNNNYNNTSSFPFPPQSTFLSCDGQSNGQCNSANILNFYNTYITNFGTTFNVASGSTNPSFYAAGLCSQPINGFSDWYLPAICQMSLGTGSSNCVSGTQNIIDNLPQLIGDIFAPDPKTSCTFGVNCLSGVYWTSTEYLLAPPLLPRNDAWYQYFDITSPNQNASAKNAERLVRCSRNLIV